MSDTERELGELPRPSGAVEIECGPAPGGGVELMYVDGYSAEQMRAYAAAEVAKERERCAEIADGYAMLAFASGAATFRSCAAEIRQPAKG